MATTAVGIAIGLGLARASTWLLTGFTSDELGETDKQLRVITRIVPPTENTKAVDADPSDERILECAVAADAEVIVSGDQHLLAPGGG